MSEALIKLDCPQGHQLENEARNGILGSILQSSIQRVFSKQTGNSSCGVQSCGIILNSLFINRNYTTGTEVIPDLENLPFTEARMYEYPETLSITNYDLVQGQGKGCTLEDVTNILKAHGCQVQQYNMSPELRIGEFRTLIFSALKDPRHGVIANYFMNALDPSYPNYGHHSPVAGFHVETDRFLILDVWPETPESWVSTLVLYNATNTTDPETKRTRGFTIATK